MVPRRPRVIGLFADRDGGMQQVGDGFPSGKAPRLLLPTSWILNNVFT